MGEMKWTENQRNAIQARDGSVLVSAAAGSGKTAVLVQRVIEIITSKDNYIPIDRMLIVTFTRAAREVMLSRVEEAINKLLKNDPYNKHLLSQRQLLYNAKINTIDGFCTDFVRQYFYLLDIQQDFKIADEKELILIKNQAMDNAIEYFYNENSKEFLNLVDAVCTYRDDERLRKNISKLYNFLVTIPFMDSWMDSKLKYYDTKATPVADSPYVKCVLDYLASCFKYCNDLVSNALQIVDADEALKEDNRIKLYDMFSQDRAFIESLTEKAVESNWDGIRSAYYSNKWCRMPGFKDETGIKESIKIVRETYKEEIKMACGLLFQDMSELKEDTDSLYPLIKAFFDCVKKFDEEFKRIKKDKNILDFSDIENNMIKLLCKETEEGVVYTDTAREISAMFDCIMVDEFQDINEVQNLIFKAISRDENNLFMVGDVKQSIYGFRQANPGIFIDYKEKYKLYDEKNPIYPAKIILDQNFRSRDCVLDACNFVFDKLMSPEVGGLNYNEEEILNCGSTAYDSTENTETEIMLINTSKAGDDNDDTKVIIEARNVAQKIHDIINKEKYLVQGKEGLRPVKEGDIAILLRSSKGIGRKAAIYVDVLTASGLMAVASEKKSIFDSNEIKILLNFLRIIDNPSQDIPLLSVLMSPIFGFTPDDFAEIRTKYPKVPIYTAVINCLSDNEKCQNFYNTLSNLRTLAVTTPVDKLIGIILEITGFDSVVMAMNGDSAKNIMLLQKYAKEYGENGYVTLGAFIGFINNVIEKGITLDGSVSAVGDNLNAVQVMSIHASKGLEFPICFICDTNTKFNTKDTTEDMVIDAKSGIGIRYKNDYVKYDTVQRKAVSLMMKKSSISEELRILYVAMTRAKERLIITAGHEDPIGYIASIAGKLTDEKLSPYVVSNFKRFSDWIVACGLLHPSGELWRKKVSCNLNITDNGDNIPWRFSIVEDEKVDNSSEDNEVESITIEPVDVEFLDKLISRIQYDYKYSSLSTLPQKVSASSLSHKENDVFEKVLNKPAFLSEKKVTGIDRGNAFHKFMEFCDLESAKVDFDTELGRLKNQGFITESQYEVIDKDRAKAFLNSDLISRVLTSEEYYREFKFTVKINAQDYDPEFNQEFADNKIVMQGAVDLAFVENNKVILVDYKTDMITDINSLEELYKKQLLLYKTAMEQSLELPVSEIYIYSLHLNQLLTINL